MNKGKSEFTENEILALKKLIDEKVKATSENQKKIRRNIRSLNFYYSDFSTQKSGYTSKDLENLILLGKIKIISNKKKAETIIKKKTPIDNVSSGIIKTELIDLENILNKFRDNKFDPEKDSEIIIPNESGNYLISLKTTAKFPNSEIELTLNKFENLNVIYTGIAGKSLKTRDFRQHFKGNNAGRSTLRKSLGALFG